MRGRKPVPTAAKKLKGTYRAHRASADEPQFDIPGRMLNPPDYLDEQGAEIWKELGGMLLRAGLFTVVDKYALGMFCTAASRWMTAEVAVRDSGGPVLTSQAGNLYQNPHMAVANKAWDQMNKLFGEFGLTPAERTRIRPPAAPEAISLVDQLAALVDQSVTPTAEKKKDDAD